MASTSRSAFDAPVTARQTSGHRSKWQSWAMNGEFTTTQKRAVAVVTVLAILFGAYFLRGYFILVVVAAIGAYLFTPLFNWLTKRFSRGLRK